MELFWSLSLHERYGKYKFSNKSSIVKRLIICLACYETQSAKESEWNIEVVKRSSRGVTFTDEGRYLVQKASIMLDFLQEIDDHFMASRSSREILRIGVPNSFARLHMPRLFKEYKNRFDRLQIATVSNSSDVLIQHLMDGSVDISIICGDYPYLGEKVCLFEENLYVAVPKGMKLEDIGEEPLIKSYLNPMVASLVNQWWKNHFGSLPHESHRVPYADIAIEMVENGLGITFLFGNFWHIDDEKVELLPIYDQNGTSISRRVWMMVSEKCFRSQDIMDFVTMVEEYYHVNQ